jgi:hypothetical protein
MADAGASLGRHRAGFVAVGPRRPAAPLVGDDPRVHRADRDALLEVAVAEDAPAAAAADAAPGPLALHLGPLADPRLPLPVPETWNRPAQAGSVACGLEASQSAAGVL